MAVKLKKLKLKCLKCDFNYQKFRIGVIEKQREDNREHKVMLKILDRLWSTDKKRDIKDVINDIENDSSYDMSADVVNQVSNNERLIRTLLDMVCENNNSRRDITVTEINMTSDILADNITLIITNSQFMPTNVEYRVVKQLDQLGDVANSDLIILRDSYHLWNSSLNLINIFKSIKEKSFVVVICKYRLTEPEEAIYSVININNNNNNMNNSFLAERIKFLKTITEESNLKLIATKTDSISTMAMMFRKVTKNNNLFGIKSVIEVKTKRDKTWFESIRKNIDEIKLQIENNNKPNNVWLIANDSHINGIVGLINCLRLETGGQWFRCIFDMDSTIKLPIDWTSKPFSDILTNDLVFNVIKDGKLGTYRHLKLPKDYDTTVSDQYFLNQSSIKDLASLRWYDSRHFQPNKEYNQRGEPYRTVPVQIYSSGLIFKDVMIAIGM